MTTESPTSEKRRAHEGSADAAKSRARGFAKGVSEIKVEEGTKHAHTDARTIFSRTNDRLRYIIFLFFLIALDPPRPFPSFSPLISLARLTSPFFPILFSLSLSFLYPFFPLSLSPFLSPCSLSHRHTFDDETNAERITDPSSYGSHRYGSSRHREYTRAGTAISAGNHREIVSSVAVFLEKCLSEIREASRNTPLDNGSRTLSGFRYGGF